MINAWNKLKEQILIKKLLKMKKAKFIITYRVMNPKKTILKEIIQATSFETAKQIFLKKMDLHESVIMSIKVTL